MRIRQVKPSFWTDARIAALPAAVRLFYIGLWMQADDAGWLRWDLPQIANELYGYESRGKRERDVMAYSAVLIDVGRVVVHPCGHAEIPKLTSHQHLSVSTKQVKTILRDHADCLDSPRVPAGPRGNPPLPAGPRGNPPLPASIGKVSIGDGGGNGTVSEGIGKGSAPANSPNGAGATMTDEDLPTFLRVVQS